MRKILTFLFVACMLASCDKNNKEIEGPTEINDGTYSGTLTVNQNDGTIYTQENVNITISFGNDIAEIKMLGVSFSNRMPIKLDMTIPDINTTGISKGLSMTGDEIIPLALGGEFPQYTIKDMKGTVSTEAITFEMLCGAYPTSFSGIKVSTKE